MLLPIMKKHVVLWSEILADRRQKVYNHARQDMYVRLRVEGWSYTRIARLFSRDHTTILSGIRNWESRNGSLKKPNDVADNVVPFVRQRSAGVGDTLAVKS
jgi:chromosomal replication initiation ATPase DnaA